MKTTTLNCTLLFCIGFVSSIATAADVTSTWDVFTNNWSDDSHWDSLLFPSKGNGGLTYDAVISSGTVTLDQAIEIEGLNQTGGTVGGTSDVAASGHTPRTGGKMSGAGTATIGGTLTISGVTTKRLSRGQFSRSVLVFRTESKAQKKRLRLSEILNEPSS